MNPGEVIGVLVCGLGVLLLVGSLLGLVLFFLPTVLNRLERPTAALKSSERPEPLAVTLMPTQEAEAPLPAKTATDWGPAGLAGLPDPQLAAAVGLALSIYLESTPGRGLIRPLTPRPASPWSLTGRWQAMNARLSLRKR